MRIYWIFTFSALILFGCNKEEKPPIEKDKFIKILVDIHLAEAAMQEMASMQRDSTGKKYYSKIFELHKVPESDFNRTLVYYKKDPEKMDALYKDVLKEIETQEKAAR